ncbi:MAG: hypothetical protein M1827_003070 [Pycnora praestabilis]|nr:MAG: hypothetical protein M1827_003070 [Pycnora praestabilis]
MATRSPNLQVSNSPHTSRKAASPSPSRSKARDVSPSLSQSSAADEDNDTLFTRVSPLLPPCFPSAPVPTSTPNKTQLD